MPSAVAISLCHRSDRGPLARQALVIECFAVYPCTTGNEHQSLRIEHGMKRRPYCSSDCVDIHYVASPVIATPAVDMQMLGAHSVDVH